jgi:inhibitor of cysteine peptidase
MKQSRTVIIVVAFVLAALVLALSGCEVDGGVTEYRDPATVIEVEKGSEFAIVLDSNPTTGYQWKLAAPLDEGIVILESTEYEEPDTELIGAGGEEKWTFKAQGLGDTTISFIYVRPWEEEGDSEEPALMEGEEEEADEAETGEEAVEEEETITEEGETTGYSWQLAQPLDEDVVEFVSSAFEKTSASSEGGEGETVGAPGEETWTFEAIGEGETEIEFEYVRPWETGVAPEETKTFQVSVTSPG